MTKCMELECSNALRCVELDCNEQAIQEVMLRDDFDAWLKHEKAVKETADKKDKNGG